MVEDVVAATVPEVVQEMLHQIAEEEKVEVAAPPLPEIPPPSKMRLNMRASQCEPSRH